jgi:ABC-type lipoprotein export system ATPase subunit
MISRLASHGMASLPAEVAGLTPPAGFPPSTSTSGGGADGGASSGGPATGGGDGAPPPPPPEPPSSQAPPPPAVGGDAPAADAPPPGGFSPSCLTDQGCWGAEAAAGCPPGSLLVRVKSPDLTPAIRCLPCQPGTYCGPGVAPLDKSGQRADSIKLEMEDMPLCPDGSFCPGPAVRVQCAAGFYCRAGSTAPARCLAPLAICRAGSTYPVLLSAWVVALAVLAVMGLGYWLEQRRVIRLGLVERLQDHYAGRLKPRLLAALWRARAAKAAAVDAATAAAADVAASCTKAAATDGVGDGADPGELAVDCARDLSTFPVVPPGARVGVVVRDVSLVVRKTRQPILRCVSCSFVPGALNYIVGPSGGGKTSLLRVLLNLHDRSAMDVTGTVTITHGGDGGGGSESVALSQPTPPPSALPPPASLPRHAQAVAYVPHEDVLPERVTAHDALTTAAALRCDASVSPPARLLRVGELERLLQLGPTKHVRVTPLGSEAGLSSGQRRRLALATELLGAPSVILGDEVGCGATGGRELEDKKRARAPYYSTTQGASQPAIRPACAGDVRRGRHDRVPHCVHPQVAGAAAVRHGDLRHPSAAPGGVPPGGCVVCVGGDGALT